MQSVDEDEDEYEEDAVTIRENLQELSGAGQQCIHCGKGRLVQAALTIDTPKSVAVETKPEGNTAESVAVQTEPEGNTAESVTVPRDQLALMRKYYVAVKDAYFNYGQTDGDAEAVVARLFERTSEVLRAVNQEGRSPIESALAEGKWVAGARLLKLAEEKNHWALSHRTTSNHDAMMLAIENGSEATVRQLIGMGYGRNVCLHYNDNGRNSLHQCALGSNTGILQLVLDDLANLLATDQVKPHCVTAALTISDCDGCSPLHYMARGNRTDMLRAVQELARDRLPSLDWDVRQSGGALNRRLTPLAMAAEANALEACEFLLRSGLAGIDLHEQRELWMLAEPSDDARLLLSQHCRLLAPLSALPPDHLMRLQEGLHERRLTDEFLLKLRTQWPDLPPLPMVVAVLAACQNFSGSCRLVVWDILKSMGQTELAQLMEAQDG